MNIITQFKNSNASTKLVIYCFFGIIWLPLLLPSSDVMVSTALFQKLSILVPSAHKLGAISVDPNVYEAYIVITGYLSLFFGVLIIFPSLKQRQKDILNNRRDFWLTINFNFFKKFIWFYMNLMVLLLLLLLLLWFFYYYPLDPVPVAQQKFSGRGTAFHIGLFGSKIGLFVLGPIIVAGASSCFCLMLFDIYMLILTPILSIKLVFQRK